MRVGWILKAGDFLRGSAELSAALRLLLLVLFLQKQEKYEGIQLVKFQFVEYFPYFFVSAKKGHTTTI